MKRERCKSIYWDQRKKSFILPWLHARPEVMWQVHKCCQEEEKERHILQTPFCKFVFRKLVTAATVAATSKLPSPFSSIFAMIKTYFFPRVIFNFIGEQLEQEGVPCLSKQKVTSRLELQKASQNYSDRPIHIPYRDHLPQKEERTTAVI